MLDNTTAPATATSGVMIPTTQNEILQSSLRQTPSTSRPATSHGVETGYFTRSSSSRVSTASSLNEIMASLPLRRDSISLPQEIISSSSDVTSMPKMNKSSIRHSVGQEWTKNHWNKIKQLEQSSSQARRCSKLSSGFAPLMIFGGLVFVCIGVSANFNSQSKDRVKLQKLSVAPLVMGSFMLMLGTILLCTWFGCRSRARAIDQKVLHGSNEYLNAKDESLLHAIFTKLYGYTNHGMTDTGGDSVFSPQVIVDRYGANDEEKAAGAGLTCARCTPSSMVVREVIDE